MSQTQDITRLLEAWRLGDKDAEAQALGVLEKRLRGMARCALAGNARPDGIQTTEIVHELYIRLAVGQPPKAWAHRGHFFKAAARLLRQILVDEARARKAQKRGGGQKPIALDLDLCLGDNRRTDLLELDDALADLARLDPEKRQLVELRFFGGLSVVETAAALNLSPATVNRHWRMAKLWLLRRLGGQAATGAGKNESGAAT